MTLYHWRLAVAKVCTHLRSDVLLPLHPDHGGTGNVRAKVDDPLVLPAWHCAFAGCSATSGGWPTGCNHEAGLWNHIWQEHSHTLTEIMKEYKLREPYLDRKEIAFAMYNESLAEMECRSCPLRGMAADRRALLHLGEVFHESSIATIMCFICGCKHIMHEGFDKFGEPQIKGNIAYRTDKWNMLHKILTHSDYSKSWEHNLSYKRFKDCFGDAVSTDPHLQPGTFE